MIVKRPSIVLCVHEPDAEMLKNICAGIEEEGVLYEVVWQEDKTVTFLAQTAMEESVLGCGVGLTAFEAAMQLKGCEKEHPVFLYTRPTLREGRVLGTNSARAIKKLPFVQAGKE